MSSKFVHAVKSIGTVESILAGFMALVWILALIAPDPSKSSVPKYVSHSETSIRIKWTTPINGCTKNHICKYEVAYREKGAPEFTSLFGEHPPDLELVIIDVTNLEPRKAYSFAVRYGSFNSDIASWSWGEFSQESLFITTGDKTVEALQKRQGPKSRSRRSIPSGGVQFSIGERFSDFRKSVSGGARSVVHMTVLLPLVYFAYGLSGLQTSLRVIKMIYGFPWISYAVAGLAAILYLVYTQGKSLSIYVT